MSMEVTEVKLAIAALTVISVAVVVAGSFGLPVNIESIITAIIAAIAGLAGYDVGYSNGKKEKTNDGNV